MQVEYPCQYLKSTKSCPELDHETALPSSSSLTPPQTSHTCPRCHLLQFQIRIAFAQELVCNNAGRHLPNWSKRPRRRRDRRTRPTDPNPSVSAMPPPSHPARRHTSGRSHSH